MKKYHNNFISEASTFLFNADSEIRSLINSINLSQRKPEKDYFLSLIRSIIYQQLSGKSAKAIFDRFVLLFLNKENIIPENIMKLDFELMRSVGLSKSKVNYIKNIAEAFIGGTIDYENFETYSDKDVMKQLISIKGVGPWTAQMFLMFTLGRSDIFPIGDLGVQKGYRIFFNLKNLPSKNTMLSRAEIWRPYRSIMAMYFWKVADGHFKH